jgi:predicted PurR-regulated permease PerM
MPEDRIDLSGFSRRVLIVVGWVTLAVLLLNLLGQLIDVLLMAFAGVLLAVAVDGLTRLVQRYAPLSRNLSLLVASVLIVLMFLGLGVLIGPQIAEQVPELIRQLPHAAQGLLETLEGVPGSAAARDLVENQTEMPGLERLAQVGGRVFSTAVGALTAILVIPLLSIYLVVNPTSYVQQFLMLLPAGKRERARQVFTRAGRALRLWLLSRLISMVFVGVTTSIGLSLLGVPLPMALGLLAGVLTFIPFLGPVIAAIPTVLVALMESPSLGLYAGLLYAGVEQVESSVVQPLAQQGVVHLPPAYAVIIQLAGGMVAGIVGVILATPLAVVATVVVQMLYVEDVLHEEIEVMGE